MKRKLKDRQASRHPGLRVSELVNKRFLFIFTAIAMATLILSMGMLYREHDIFQVEQVKLQGNTPRMSQAALNNVLAPYVGQDFFSVDVYALQHQLVQIPWVANASVRRVWPHSLSVDLAEQSAVARFGPQSVVDSEGQVFTPESHTIPSDLPIFAGPDSQANLMLSTYQKMLPLLKPLHLSINQLQLTSRHAWQLTLSNGTELVLGREGELDRLQRFVKVYSRLFANKAKPAERVDLRYRNGMSVKW